jgi:hypothetical protein
MIRDLQMRYKSADADGNFSLYVGAHPEALMAELLADICSDCGHIVLKVQAPQDLYSRCLQSKM